MSICLSHNSADPLLEALAQHGEELETRSAGQLEGFTANIDEVRAVLGDDLAHISPVDVLVGSPGQLRSSDGVCPHLWSGSVPEGSIKRYREGLYVASPEFCLLQQARELHTVSLCQMLGRFLATAAPEAGGGQGAKLTERSPLTTLRRLDEFLSDPSIRYGTQRLQEAMRYTLPGAASPQETNLQLALMLPYKYYGFGFKNLKLNHHIELGQEARRLYDADYIAIDVYFGKPHPDGREDANKLRAFGLEYLGEDYHQDPGRDIARFLAAHAENVDLWFVAHEQLQNAHQLDRIAQEAARRMRRRIKPSSWPSVKDLSVLLDVLNGVKIPKQNDCQRERTSMTRGAA